MSEWMSKWMSKWLNEWVSEWVSEWLSELVSERVNEWMTLHSLSNMFEFLKYIKGIIMQPISSLNGILFTEMSLTVQDTTVFIDFVIFTVFNVSSCIFTILATFLFVILIARSSDNRVSSSSKEGSKNRRPLFKPGGTRNPVLETKQIHRWDDFFHCFVSNFFRKCFIQILGWLTMKVPWLWPPSQQQTKTF